VVAAGAVVVAGAVVGAVVTTFLLGSSTLAGDGVGAAAAGLPAGAAGGGFSALATSEPVTQSAAIAGRSPTRVRTAVFLIIPQSPKAPAS
jgi:hypothetical protein